MIDFMGVDVNDYKWKPYPSKTYEETQAFGFTDDELDGLPFSKKEKINRLRSEYVSRITSHRYENKSNFDFLKNTVLEEFRKSGNEDGITQVEAILEEHRQKERGIYTLTRNRTFQSLNYI